MSEQTQKIKSEVDDDSMADSDRTADKDIDKASHTQHFQVDMNLIPAAHLKDEDDDLRGLGLDVFNQEELEQGELNYTR